MSKDSSLTGNVREGIPESLPEELTQTLVTRPNTRIERILSRGQASPPDFWYDQAQHEFVLLVSGRAILEFETSRGDIESGSERRHVELGPGDWIQIDARVKHRVHWTDPAQTSVWVVVFYGP